MYLPQDKYSIQVALPGQFVVKGTGEPYIGQYMKLFTGRCFAGTDILNATVEIEQTYGSETSRQPVSIVRKVTAEEYLSGYMYRYFKYDTVSKKSYEITKNEFEQGKLKPVNYLKYERIKWVLIGLAKEDVTIDGYLYRGVRSKNQETIDALEKEMPGVSSILSDPEEFVKARLVFP